MKDFMKKNPEVLDAVMNDEIQFFPEKLKNTYRHWIENIRDWNISRQLWWGHRIPAFYAPDGTFMVAKDAEEAVLKFKESGIDVGASDLQQDEDVLDTWFSSWLWPISVFDGFESDKETAYYYPTNDLVTAPEIMFFWVARMIMAGYEYRDEKPFKNVYYTGIVRDKQRRKMSKSLGNSPDPLDLIAQYGADSVRLGMLLCAPAGNDILFDESQVEQGRNFANKIWNAYRLVSSWDGEETPIRPYEKETADWFAARMGEVLKQNESHFSQFRLSDALMGMYKLVWDDFCSTFLEGVKPPYGEKISSEGLSIAKEFLSNLMKMIHPIMPFISEEIYQGINPGSDCITASYPKMEQGSSDDLDVPLSVITEIRNLRVQQQLSPKQSLKVEIKNPSKEILHYSSMIGKLANIQIVDGFEVTSNL
ncbi:MAG: valine--tRNA ligase, partial [Chitinophagia bacterium]|nr:valine--tRNA ligase [Chitinophagia bacterium]